MSALAAAAVALLLAGPASADDISTSQDMSFLSSKDVRVLKADRNTQDAEVEWGGVKVRISEVESRWGKVGTRALWNNLSDQQRFQVLNAYCGSALTPWPHKVYDHFDDDTAHKLMGMYRKNTVIAVKEQQAAVARIAERVPAEAKRVRADNPPTLGSEYEGLDATGWPDYAAARETERQLKEAQSDVQSLWSMAEQLEAERLGTALAAATAFAFESAVGLVTGNVYQTTGMWSQAIGEAVQKAYDLYKNAVREDQSPEEIIRALTRIQEVYLSGMGEAAGRYFNLRGRLEQQIEGLRKKAKEEVKRRAEAKEKREQRAEQEVDAAVTPTVPAVPAPPAPPNEDEAARQARIREAVQKKRTEIRRAIGAETARALKAAQALGELEASKDWRGRFEKNSTGVSIAAGGLYASRYSGGDYLPALMAGLELVRRRMPELQGYGSFMEEMANATAQKRADAAKALGELQGQLAGLNSAYGAIAGVESLRDLSENEALKHLLQVESHYRSMAELARQLAEADGKEAAMLEKAAADRKTLLATFRERYGTASSNFQTSLMTIGKNAEALRKAVEGVAKEEPWTHPSPQVTFGGLVPSKAQAAVLKASSDGDFAGAEAALAGVEAVAREAVRLEEALRIAIGNNRARQEEMDSLGGSPAAGEVNTSIDRGYLGGSRVEAAWEVARRFKSLDAMLEGVATGADPGKVEEARSMFRAVRALNARVQQGLKQEADRIQAALEAVDARAAALLPQPKFEEFQAELNRKIGSYGLFRYQPESLKLAKLMADFQYWSPVQDRSFEDGEFIAVPRMWSRQTEQAAQALDRMVGDFWAKGKGKALLDERAKLGRLRAYVTDVTWTAPSGRLLKKGEAVSVADFGAGPLTVRGTAVAGMPVEYVEVYIEGGPKERADLGTASREGDLARTPFEWKVQVQEGVWPLWYVAYQGGMGEGTGETLIIRDDSALQREVRELYDRFVRAYRSADARGVLDCLDPEWTSSTSEDIQDLEDHLRGIFTAFRRFEVDLTGLKTDARQTPKYAGSASYSIAITAELAEQPDIRHEEKGQVTDHLVRRDGKLRIGRTVGTGFFFKR